MKDTRKRYSEPDPPSIAADAVVAYSSQPLAERAADGHYLEHLRSGITAEYYFMMAEDSGLSLEELSAIFHVTSRTLRRIQEGDTLSMDLAEKVLQLRRLYNVGEYVIGDRTAFVGWLRQPLMALEGSTPLSYLDSSFGIDVILDMLGRIEYGVYS